MRKRLFNAAALIGLGLSFAAEATGDDKIIDDLTASLDRNVELEMVPLFRSELEQSGLSSCDIDRIVAELKPKVVACFLDSLFQHAETHDVDPTDLISEFDGDFGIGPIGGDFALLLNNCLNTVRQEAGVSSLP